MIPHFRSSNSLKSDLGCRLVQMTLALYLLPAILIVLVVGAVGILIIGVIRFFTLVLGTTAEGGDHGRRENVAWAGRKASRPGLSGYPLRGRVAGAESPRARGDGLAPAPSVVSLCSTTATQPSRSHVGSVRTADPTDRE